MVQYRDGKDLSGVSGFGFEIWIQAGQNATINIKSEGIKFLRSSLDKVDASLGVSASFLEIFDQLCFFNCYFSYFCSLKVASGSGAGLRKCLD